MYTKTVVENEEHCLRIMANMEEAFKERDEDYFMKVLEDEGSLVLRVHAVCMLADIGTEKSVGILSDVLLNDPDPLVKHEAAFSLGQMGYPSANGALERAVRKDPNEVVRHEAAAALGSIGSQSARTTLETALKDTSEIVRNSARTSLVNLDFLMKYSVGSSARERAPRP